MSKGSDVIVPSTVIRLRYRDRYVYLEAGGGNYGTMTRYLDGLIEFDFSSCEVLRTEAIPAERQKIINEGDTHQ